MRIVREGKNYREEPAADCRAAGEAMTLQDCDETLEDIRQILDMHLLNGATHCHMMRWKFRQLASAPPGAVEKARENVLRRRRARTLQETATRLERTIKNW